MRHLLRFCQSVHILLELPLLRPPENSEKQNEGYKKSKTEKKEKEKDIYIYIYIYRQIDINALEYIHVLQTG